jgi:CheY-like chemotaxis protein
MDDSQDNQAHFIHAFSSPLTSMRGALDLLRHPLRMPEDPVTRELIETLERSCARLRVNVETLLKYSSLNGDMIEIVAPMDVFLANNEQSSAASAHSSAQLAAPAYARAPQDQLVPATDAAGIRGSVLIIGDTMPDWQMIDTTLRAAGYGVLDAHDGALGIDMAREWRPDLIVLDLDLPLPGAQQVAQVLREDPETKTIPMIFAAGVTRPPQHLPPHVELLPRACRASANVADRR